MPSPSRRCPKFPRPLSILAEEETKERRRLDWLGEDGRWGCLLQDDPIVLDNGGLVEYDCGCGPGLRSPWWLRFSRDWAVEMGTAGAGAPAWRQFAGARG